jgi:hypothetical protein
VQGIGEHQWPAHIEAACRMRQIELQRERERSEADQGCRAPRAPAACPRQQRQDQRTGGHRKLETREIRTRRLAP